MVTVHWSEVTLVWKIGPHGLFDGFTVRFSIRYLSDQWHSDPYMSASLNVQSVALFHACSSPCTHTYRRESYMNTFSVVKSGRCCATGMRLYGVIFCGWRRSDWLTSEEHGAHVQAPPASWWCINWSGGGRHGATAINCNSTVAVCRRASRHVWSTLNPQLHEHRSIEAFGLETTILCSGLCISVAF